jgi:hypothetical protein
MQHTKEDRWNTSNKRLKHNCENAWKHSKTIANTCNIQMIHLQHTYETPEMLETYACNMQHPDLLLQHPDKTLTTYVYNRWNIWNIHLKHTYIAITTCATSRSTFATLIYYTCTTPLKHLKHTERRLQRGGMGNRHFFMENAGAGSVLGFAVPGRTHLVRQTTWREHFRIGPFGSLESNSL